MPAKKLLILSLDAFGEADLEIARKLPNFQRFFKAGSLVTNVKSVYPTLTYMCHNSIARGLFPIHHGVVNNTKLEPGIQTPNWYWFKQDTKGVDFFTLAKRAGLKTASLLWPSTGRHPHIDYNLAEIFPTKPWHHQILMSLYAGSPCYSFELERRFGHLRQGKEQPALDYFLRESLFYTLAKYQPDLTAVHFLALDEARHHFGVHSKEAHEALYLMDETLGQLLDTLQALPAYRGQTAIAILGDHYQIDVHTELHPNALFQTLGMMPAVWANEAAGACYIYVDQRKIRLEEVKSCIEPYTPYFAEIYEGEEIAKLGADPRASFLIEAKPGYYFTNDSNGPFACPSRNYRAVHGYHPLRDNYQTMFAMMGPGIRQNYEKAHAWLVDEGPTFLHALGLTYPTGIDGQVHRDLFL